MELCDPELTEGKLGRPELWEPKFAEAKLVDANCAEAMRVGDAASLGASPRAREEAALKLPVAGGTCSAECWGSRVVGDFWSVGTCWKERLGAQSCRGSD